MQILIYSTCKTKMMVSWNVGYIHIILEGFSITNRSFSGYPYFRKPPYRSWWYKNHILPSSQNWVLRRAWTHSATWPLRSQSGHLGLTGLFHWIWGNYVWDCNYPLGPRIWYMTYGGFVPDTKWLFHSKSKKKQTDQYDSFDHVVLISLGTCGIS